MRKIRIVVVDDHEVVRHGLRLSLDSEPDMEVVGEARTGEEAVRVVVTARPDLVLLDVKLEDIDGPEVCRRVVAAVPKTAVLMLTSYLQDGVLLRSLVAGAKGYVIKDVELSELKRMIRLVYRGGSVLDPRAAPKVIATATGGRARAASRGTLGDRAAALSDTDLSIIRYLSQGFTNKEIAARVHLSPHTVKDHLDKIREILDVRSRTEVVTKALSAGLILPA